MKIIKGIYITHRLIFLGLCALVFLTSLTYFLGWKLETETFLIYAAIIAIEIITFIFTFLIIRKVRKKHFEFNMDKQIFLVTKKTKVYITSLGDIVQIFYVRFFWTYLLQFGAGYLHIKYKNEKGDISYYSISMSPKDVMQLTKIYRIKIEIK